MWFTVSAAHPLAVLHHSTNVVEVLKVLRVHGTKLSDFVTNSEALQTESNKWQQWNNLNFKTCVTAHLQWLPDVMTSLTAPQAGEPCVTASTRANGGGSVASCSIASTWASASSWPRLAFSRACSLCRASSISAMIALWSFCRPEGQDGRDVSFEMALTENKWWERLSIHGEQVHRKWSKSNRVLWSYCVRWYHCDVHYIHSICSKWLYHQHLTNYEGDFRHAIFWSCVNKHSI